MNGHGLHFELLEANLAGMLRNEKLETFITGNDLARSTDLAGRVLVCELFTAQFEA